MAAATGFQFQPGCGRRTADCEADDCNLPEGSLQVLTAEVGGDDGRRACALERAVREAEPDAVKRGTEQVRTVPGAPQPQVDDRLSAAVRARAPREVLAERAVEMEGGHPAGEVAVTEVVPAQHVQRVRL